LKGNEVIITNKLNLSNGKRELPRCLVILAQQKSLEKFEKRKHSEITQPVRPLPSLDVFDRIDTGAWTMPHNPCPPTPRAGHYELRDLDGHAVYWKKKYDLNGKLIGFA
jgi:hypothetical protein